MEPTCCFRSHQQVSALYRASLLTLDTRLGSNMHQTMLTGRTNGLSRGSPGPSALLQAQPWLMCLCGLSLLSKCCLQHEASGDSSGQVRS